MKAYFIFLLSISLSLASYGQAGEWVWIHGSQAASDPGNYGAKGVPSASNDPPALYEAMEWKDLNGNFWLYGGSYIGDFDNDLWRYNPLTNEWTWMSGT